MPKKPKPLNEQPQRTIEKAEEMGADAFEEQFERPVRRLVPPAGVSARPATFSPFRQKRVVRKSRLSPRA